MEVAGGPNGGKILLARARGVTLPPALSCLPFPKVRGPHALACINAFPRLHLNAVEPPAVTAVYYYALLAACACPWWEGHFLRPCDMPVTHHLSLYIASL